MRFTEKQKIILDALLQSTVCAEGRTPTEKPYIPLADRQQFIADLEQLFSEEEAQTLRPWHHPHPIKPKEEST